MPGVSGLRWTGAAMCQASRNGATYESRRTVHLHEHILSCIPYHALYEPGYKYGVSPRLCDIDLPNNSMQ